MITSLSKFCKDRGLPKSSVYDRCKELKLDVSAGLTAEMVTQLESEFDVVSPVKKALVEVEVGNHQIVLGQPNLPAKASLEGLRSVESARFEDPLAIAAEFLEFAEQLETAMKDDVAARRKRLEDTQLAEKKIAEKRQQLELEARLYELQTSTVDGDLSRATASLQDELGKLSKFKKSQEAE